MGALLSVNVGLPKEVSWQGKTVFTGVFKDPVSGPRRVGRLNMDGDGQGDLAGHGGEQRAVFVYQIESYRYWAWSGPPGAGSYRISVKRDPAAAPAAISTPGSPSATSSMSQPLAARSSSTGAMRPCC